MGFLCWSYPFGKHGMATTIELIMPNKALNPDPQNASRFAVRLALR